MWVQNINVLEFIGIVTITLKMYFCNKNQFSTCVSFTKKGRMYIITHTFIKQLLRH